jgi:hypothetical protein
MQLVAGLLANKRAETKTPQQVWRIDHQITAIELEPITQPELEYRSWYGLRYYQRWYKPF